jgi:hypothetical protein
MLFSKETEDKIEDALIHFEDAGYNFNISHQLSCDDRGGDKTYDILKRVITDDEVEFGDKISITLYHKAHYLKGNQVMTWKEYQWYQSEFKTAILRMTDNLDGVTIFNTSDYKTLIEIKGDTWNFQNIKKLTEKTRYFNANNTFNNLIVYPEYHVYEGIVLYVRGFDSDRRLSFDTFNHLLKDTNPSIEGVFGKDCVIKLYDEGEAEKENPYLSTSLSKGIVAKLNCDFIKV